MPAPRDPNLLLAAARAYYLEGKSQAEIAVSLETSRSNVSRMLTEAQRQGKERPESALASAWAAARDEWAPADGPGRPSAAEPRAGARLASTHGPWALRIADVDHDGRAEAVVALRKPAKYDPTVDHRLHVYAFDGEPKIHSVVPFTEAQGSVQGGLEGLRRYKPKDPSTNLHGAVVEGLKELKKELDKDKRPLKFGTLVVFSDGTDRAARFSRDEMKSEINKDVYDDYEMYAIGVGAEIKKAGLGDIGRDGTELANESADVKAAFLGS